MDEQQLEDLLRQALEQDYSTGTEQFRDALLARCLAELNADLDADLGAADLDDTDLEMVAAAGSVLDAEELLQPDEGDKRII